MFNRELTQAGHRRLLSISERRDTGWEVRDVQDERILKQVSYTDWHRVERALQIFTLVSNDLEEHGWKIAATR